MNNQWYINSNGKNKGPYSALELQMLFDSREINSFTMCYNKGSKKWMPYFDAKAFFPKPKSLTDILDVELPDVPGTEAPLPDLPILPELPEFVEVDIPALPSVEDKDLDIVSELSQTKLPESTSEQLEENPEEEKLQDESQVDVEDINDEVYEEVYEEIYEDEISLISPQEASSEVEVSSNVQDEQSASENVLNFKPKPKHTNKVAEIKSPSSEKLPTHIVAGASIFIVIGMFASFLLFSSNSKSEVTFKNISFDVLKELQSVSSSSNGSKFYIKFGLDKSSEVVFGKSNLAVDAVVNAQFKRINSDNLGDKVSFSSSAVLKNGSVVFNELEFNEGEKIIEGEYEVKVNAVSSSLLSRLKNLFFKNSAEYKFEEKTYLLPSNLKEYENKIASIKATKKLVEEEILNGLDQKLQTIDSILTSLALHYRLSLNKNSGKESSKEFESRYSSSAGPLLQSIILEDYESLLSKSEQKVEFRQVSGLIHASAKDVSALSAQLSTELQKLQTISPKTRAIKRDELAALTAKNKEKINDIRLQITKLLEKVKAQ